MGYPPLIPTVHANGTGYAELVEQHATALRKVNEAIEALHAARPNARDYYPQGPGAPASAQREHDGRVAWLQQVRDDLDDLLLGVRKQQRAAKIRSGEE